MDKSKLTGRKFLVALFSFLFVGLTEVFGWQMSQQKWDFITNIVISFIAGQGLVDVMSNWKQPGPPAPK